MSRHALKRILAFFSASVIGAAVDPTAIQAKDLNIKAVTFLEGDCRLQLTKGFVPCKGSVMWTEYDNGREMLSFFKGDTAFSLSGGGDRQPNPENYYQSIDTIRILEGGKRSGAGQGVEGECHFNLNEDATKFFSIKCDVYNRRNGSSYKFHLENIRNFKRKTF